MSHTPTSGQVTSDPDQVTITIDWDTWPENQGIVYRAGNLIVAGTYQGNPVQGSPQTVAVTAQKDTGTIVGSENCPSGTRCIDDPICNADNCGGNLLSGPAWLGWCYANECRTAPGGWKYLGSNSTGVSIAGFQPGRHVANSNDVIMRCQVRWPQSWINGVHTGCQHLGHLGVSASRPCTYGNWPEIQENSIKVDFSAADPLGGEPGPGLRHGLQIILVERRHNVFYDDDYHDTEVMNVWDADTWYDMEWHAHHDPSQGRVTGKIVYKAGVERTFSYNTPSGQPGNPHLLSFYVGWGNFDGRPFGDNAEIRNISYEVGGNVIGM
jgi:hypothetical protein